MNFSTLNPYAAAVLLIGTTSALATAQGIDYDKTQFTTTQLSQKVYVLTGSAGTDAGHPEGAGGKIGILAGRDGILMVDASYLPMTEKIVASIRKISPAPIRFLVDTHEHPDHTGGNPNFAKMGALVISRDEVRTELAAPAPPALIAAAGKAASWTDPARLPVLTYGLGSTVRIYLDGETVDLIPVRAAHTDGDTIVRFEKGDVMMIGDFYRNYGYPFIDPAHGGTFKGVLEALDTVTQIAGPDTKLVPGHGSIINRSDIAPYRAMILDVESKVQQMIDQGKTLQEVLAAKVTAPYDAKVPGGLKPLPAGLGNSADRFIRALYAELKSGKS